MRCNGSKPYRGRIKRQHSERDGENSKKSVMSKQKGKTGTIGSENVIQIRILDELLSIYVFLKLLQKDK